MPDVAYASGISAQSLITGYDLVRGAAGQSEVVKKTSQEHRRHSENFENRHAARDSIKSYRTDQAQRRESMGSIATENFCPAPANINGRNYIAKMISSTRATKMEMTLHGKVKDMVEENESEPSDDETYSGKGCEVSSSSASRYSKVVEGDDQRYYSWGGGGGSRDRIVAKNKPKFNAFKLKLAEMQLNNLSMNEPTDKSFPLKETTNCSVPRGAAVRRSGGGGVAYHTPRQMQHVR